MLDFVKPMVAALAMPLSVALLFFLMGLLLRLLSRRLLASGAFALALLLALGSSWAPLADRLLAPLEQVYDPVSVDAVDQEVAAIIVLGGGWDPDASWPATSRLGESSSQRLIEGLRLLAAFPEATLIVSGGSRYDQEGSVRGYALAIAELGVEVQHLLVLDAPVDTAQEAYAVRETFPEGLEGRLVFLVTSASHMPRAVQHFQRVGLDPIAAPAHFLTGRSYANPLSYWLPSSNHLRKTERAIYEYLGLWALEWDHR